MSQNKVKALQSVPGWELSQNNRWKWQVVGSKKNNEYPENNSHLNPILCLDGTGGIYPHVLFRGKALAESWEWSAWPLGGKQVFPVENCRDYPLSGWRGSSGEKEPAFSALHLMRVMPQACRAIRGGLPWCVMYQQHASCMSSTPPHLRLP